MQLILIDETIVGHQITEQSLKLVVDQSILHKRLLEHKERRRGLLGCGSSSNDEDGVRKNLVSKIMTKDISSSLVINSWLRGTPTWTIEIKVIPCDPNSILHRLAELFQEHVKISVYFKDPARAKLDLACAEDMRIMKNEGFMCRRTVHNMNSSKLPKKIHLKLVASIADSVVANIIKGLNSFVFGASFPQQILESGTFSDVVITAENGAEIKAHKNFLSVCSPVFKAMLKSGMEESQTGRVDMSDMSEEGVRAFLRYVYYEFLQSPKENIRVAYELLYAGHKYDVPSLEAEMKMLLLETKNEEIGEEWAFKIFMFTRNIDSAVEIKTKAMEILSMQVGVSASPLDLEADIEMFLREGNNENIDAPMALEILIMSRNIESAVDLKNKAIRILSRDVELPFDVNDLGDVVQTFFAERKEQDIDLAGALKMYLFARNLQSARAEELKNMSLRVLKANLSALTSLPVYKDLFENSVAGQRLEKCGINPYPVTHCFPYLPTLNVPSLWGINTILTPRLSGPCEKPSNCNCKIAKELWQDLAMTPCSCASSVQDASAS